MYKIIRFFLFLFKPEIAHKIVLMGLGTIYKIPGGQGLLKLLFTPRKASPREYFGVKFKNPVGLAAGFDKNARHLDPLSTLGFGFIEIGSVTARAAAGNAKPRLFRLPRDGAIINRMGLNNDGAEAIAARLSNRVRTLPLFINIAKTHDKELEGKAAVDDYCQSIDCMKEFADVLVLNISCPNSGDGRTFEDPEALERLLLSASSAIGVNGPPFLVKVSPDLTRAELQCVVQLAIEHGAAGFTATNTTVNRIGLKTPESEIDAIGAGGLSGAPLHIRALGTVRIIRELTDLPIIGVGGIRGAEQARNFLDAGANLVQIYSGFIYAGPSLVKNICRNLPHT